MSTTQTTRTEANEAIASIRAQAVRLEANGFDVWPALRHVSAALAATTDEELVAEVRAAQDVIMRLADRHVAATTAPDAHLEAAYDEAFEL